MAAMIQALRRDRTDVAAARRPVAERQDADGCRRVTGDEPRRAVSGDGPSEFYGRGDSRFAAPVRDAGVLRQRPTRTIAAVASGRAAERTDVAIDRRQLDARRGRIDLMTSPNSPAAVRVIDSHTGGEPTRVVVEGAPTSAVATWPAAELPCANRPIGSARRSSPSRAAASGWSARCCRRRFRPTAAAGVIFFNNVGYLGMCGHGLIGVVATLAYLGRIGPGAASHRNTGRRCNGRASRKRRRFARERSQLSHG